MIIVITGRYNISRYQNGSLKTLKFWIHYYFEKQSQHFLLSETIRRKNFINCKNKLDLVSICYFRTKQNKLTRELRFTDIFHQLISSIFTYLNLASGKISRQKLSFGNSVAPILPQNNMCTRHSTRVLDIALSKN